MTPKEFLERKEANERLRREADRKTGVVEVLNKQLKEQFGITIKEAPKILEGLRKEEAKIEKEANTVWENFKDKREGILQ